jgi:hypothetical protein
MGYSTKFSGIITVTPPLNARERTYLREFAEVRHMDRDQGPYYIEGGNNDIRHHDRPFYGQPSLWCCWVPTADGTGIVWNGQEKSAHGPEWIAYLRDHFLAPDAIIQQMQRDGAWPEDWPSFEGFTFDHTLNGIMSAEGDNPDDVWGLVVTDNEITVREWDEEIAAQYRSQPSPPQQGPVVNSRHERNQADKQWQDWLAAMDTEIAQLLAEVPDMPADPWSREAFLHVGQFALDRFATLDEVKSERDNWPLADRIARYFGESLHRNFEARWENVRENYPGIEQYQNIGPAVSNEWTDVYLEVGLILTGIIYDQSIRRLEIIWKWRVEDYPKWVEAGRPPRAEYLLT